MDSDVPFAAGIKNDTPTGLLGLSAVIQGGEHGLLVHDYIILADVAIFYHMNRLKNTA